MLYIYISYRIQITKKMKRSLGEVTTMTLVPRWHDAILPTPPGAGPRGSQFWINFLDFFGGYNWVNH